ncbi:unnamed protein product [Aphanomyces euteiches]
MDVILTLPRKPMLRSAQPKYSTFDGDASIVHPRQQASLLSKVFFSWCIPLVQEQRQLNIDDVWPLEDVNKSDTNTQALTEAFKRTQSVFWSGIDVYGVLYAAIGFMSLLARLLDLVGPIVLQKVVESTSDANQMYFWLGALLIAKVTRAIVWSHCIVLDDTLGIRFASGLKGMLFRKLLSKASHSNSDIPDLANVYSADMDTLLWASTCLNNLWILPTQVLAISYMLYQQIGAAAFAGMGMIVLTLLLGSWISTIQSNAYEKVSTSRDQRMQAVKETFGSILVVKLQAWEEKCREKIQKLRDIELGYVWTLMASGAASIFILWATPLFVSVTSFAVYSVVMNQPLTATKVFTSLALFRQLQDPVRDLPENITAVVEARISLKRVHSYLAQEDKPARPEPDVPEEKNVAVTIQNGALTWGDDTSPILKDVNLTVHRGVKLTKSEVASPVCAWPSVVK